MKMKKSCVESPRMLYFYTILIFGLLSSVRVVLSELVINEVSLENENEPKFVYVELINKGAPVVADDYLLVFYNGQSKSSLSISKLNNVSLDTGSFYVVALTGANLAHVSSFSGLPPLGDTIGAVALFKINGTFSGSSVSFVVENATRVDALVFTTGWNANFSGTDLATAFKFKTKQIILGGVNQSLSLCGNDTQSAFKNATKTPGTLNNCGASPPLAPPTTITKGSNVTRVTGSSTVTSVPLTPVTPSQDHTQVTTTTNNPTQTTNISPSTPSTTLVSTNLSSTTNQSPSSNPGVNSTSTISATTTTLLVSTTTPSSPASSVSSSSTASSLPASTSQSAPSPTATVPVVSTSEKPTISQKVVISEVYVNPPSQGDIGEYVELLDLNGKENVSLDGLSLVFWNGANLQYYFTINLTGYKTSTNGYFVISNLNDSNTHIHHNKLHSIQNGPMDGIVLYKDLNTTAVEHGQILADTVLDAVVYTKGGVQKPNHTLLQTLFPNQTFAIPLFSNSGHTIISRCYSNEPRDLAAFMSVNITTKAARNFCTKPQGLRINELKWSSSKFIELTSGERAFFPLEQMVLTTFDALTNQARGSLRLSDRTNPNMALLAETPLKSTLQINATNLLDFLNDTIAGAVALYWIPDLASKLNINTTSDGFLDIIIYGTVTKNASLDFLATFKKTQVNLPNDLGNRSVNYCPHDKRVYVIDVPSPNSENQCPAPPTTIAPNTTIAPTTPPTPVDFQINEVYFGKSPNFVEIKGPSKKALDNLLVVFFVDGTPIDSNHTVNLASKSLSTDGFYVFEATLPQSKEKESAVVLYELPSATYNVTTFDKLKQDAILLDFVVYTTEKTMEPSALITALDGSTTDQIAIWADTVSSITRCGAPLREIWSFWLMQPTKDGTNTCQTPEVLINEINADNPGYDSHEFLELYDFGLGSVSLNPFVLVSFNGKTGETKAVVINLWNEKTDEKGFFLLAYGQKLSSNASKNVTTNQFFQNGPDAIALYKATPSTFKSDSQPIADELVDVVIYGKNASDPLILPLIKALTPGGSSVVTLQINNSVDLSMSRCLCWGTKKKNNAKAFILSKPTPSKLNICPQNFTTDLPPLLEIFINELNSDSNGPSGEYLELKGPTLTKLANCSLVFYDLSNGQVIQSINLDDQSLNKDGYFIIGDRQNATTDVQKMVFLKKGLGAIALYDRRHWECVPEDQMTINRPGLLDAIVYTSSNNSTDLVTKAKDYLETLNLDNYVVEDPTAFKHDESINRCFDDRKNLSSRFAVSVPTPGKKNICPSEEYKVPISFKLIEADCKEFTTNATLKMEVATFVVENVNANCQCGLTFANLFEYKFVCGSVIMDATIYAFNKEQQALIDKSYGDFIKTVGKVSFANKTYTVDKSCLRNCRSVKPLTKKAEDHTVTIAVVVTCVVILAIISVIVFVYYKRKRKGIAHFRMARFDAEDENLTVGDMDDFVGGGEQASFNNPLYFKS